MNNILVFIIFEMVHVHLLVKKEKGYSLMKANKSVINIL